MAQTSRSSPAIGGAVPTQWKYALNWTRLSCQTIDWPCRT